MIDPKRLTALVKRKQQTETTDPSSAILRADPRETERLQFAGYMELADEAGAFSCGTCKYATASRSDVEMPEEPPPEDDDPSILKEEMPEMDTPDGGPFCTLDSIRAPVSLKHGCCSRFFPAEGWPVFGADNDQGGCDHGDMAVPTPRY